MNDISPIIPFKKLKNTKAWKLTSEYVRRTAKGRCYTCGAIVPFKKMHSGHFQEKTGAAAIYFDLRGIRGQCYRCNRLLHGNKAVFAAKLLKEEDGAEIIRDLVIASQKSKVWRKNEVNLIASALEEKIAAL